MKQSWKKPLSLEDAEVISIENYISQFSDVLSPTSSLTNSQPRLSLPTGQSFHPSASTITPSVSTKNSSFLPKPSSPTYHRPLSNVSQASDFLDPPPSQLNLQQQYFIKPLKQQLPLRNTSELNQRNIIDDRENDMIQSSYTSVISPKNSIPNSFSKRGSLAHAALYSKQEQINEDHDNSLEDSLKKLLEVVNKNMQWKREQESPAGAESLLNIQSAINNYEQRMKSATSSSAPLRSKKLASLALPTFTSSPKQLQQHQSSNPQDLTKEEFKLMQLETENYLLREQVSGVKNEKSFLNDRIADLEARSKQLEESLQQFNDKFLNETTSSSLKRLTVEKQPPPIEYSQRKEIVQSIESVIAMQNEWEAQTRDMDSLSLSLLRAYTPAELQDKLEERVQKIESSKQQIRQEMINQLQSLSQIQDGMQNSSNPYSGSIASFN